MAGYTGEEVERVILALYAGQNVAEANSWLTLFVTSPVSAGALARARPFACASASRPLLPPARPPSVRAAARSSVRAARARTGRQRSGCEQSSAPASGAGQASPPRLPCLHPPDPGPNPDPTSSLRPRPASARAPTPIVRCAGRLGDFGHHDQQVCFADL